MNRKGITLIALVITVVVLLILAGTAVTIGLNGGDLFKHTNNAVNKWNNGVKREDIAIRELLLYYNKKTASGNVATFSDGASDLAIDNVTIAIEPIQEGAGEPSPENPQSIEGWTEVNIYHSGENRDNYETLNISLPQEAGIVYGGTLDITNGTLTVTGIKYVLNNETQWRMQLRGNGATGVYFYKELRDEPLLCAHSAGQWNNINMVEKYTHGVIENSWSSVGNNAWVYAANDTTTVLRISFSDDMNIDSVEKLNDWIDSQDEVAIYYPIKNSITYNVTPEEIKMLSGTNNLWSDAGDTSVVYKAEESQN